MITQTINLSMIPGSVPPSIHVNQFDNDAGALIFKLYTTGDYSIPAGSAVLINGTKPDGYGFSYSATYSGNTVTADITEQMTAVAGEVKCELRISNGGDVIGTQNFTLAVEPAALDDGTVISDSDIPAIAAAVDAAADAETSATDAAVSAAQAAADAAKIFGIGTKIGNTDNLNDYKTPGKYYAEVGQTITNAPISGGFAMLIYPAYNVARFAQVVFGLDGSVSVRALYGEYQGAFQWSDWWTSNYSAKLTGVTTITQATDYNTIRTPGEYVFTLSSNARGSNAPKGNSTVAGRLTVEHGMTGAQVHVRQTYRYYNSADTFTRVYYKPTQGDATWTNWYQYSMTDTGA